MKNIDKKILGMQFGLKKRASLYIRIARFLDAKIPLSNALTSIRDRYAKDLSLLERIASAIYPGFKTKGDARGRIIASWLEQMAKGEKFSDSVKDWVPASEFTLIAAGERGRGLASGLREATTMSEASSKIKKTIIVNSIEPVVLLAAIGYMLALFQNTMVPIFKTFAPLSEWPDNAYMLYSVSYFFTHYMVYLIIGGVIAGVASIISLSRWRGKWRTRFDVIVPPWSIYRVQQSSSFLLALSSLQETGVTIYKSLQLMYGDGSKYFRWHMEKMMSRLSRGVENPGSAMDTGLLDRETAGEVEDYSQLGTFMEAIKEIGKRNLEDSLTKINAMMQTFNKVMLVVVAAMVMWIYATTYTFQGTLANSSSGVGSNVTNSL